MKRALTFVALGGTVGIVFLAGYWYSHRQWISDPKVKAVIGIPAPHDHSTHSHAGGQPADESPRDRQVLGIQTKTAEVTRPARKLRLIGRVAVDESRLHKLIAGSDGFIVEVAAITSGDQVKRNQQLAVFSAPSLRAPVSGFITTLEAFDNQKAAATQSQQQSDAAKNNYEIAIDRLYSLGVSSVQIDEIKRSRTIPTLFAIRSPVDGIIVARNVSPGQRFEKGLEWYRIADLSHVWLIADVFEADMARIKSGARARVVAPGGKLLPAAVSQSLPQFDPGSRTFKVRLDLANPGIILRPEMIADVEIDLPMAPALTVPTDAIISTGKQHVVYVEIRPGEFQPRTVDIGWRAGGEAQILNGLAQGERVVVTGAFLLDSESRMKLGAGEPSASADKSQPRPPPPAHDHSTHQHP